MARERPTASDDKPNLVCLDGDRSDSDGPLLTLAEAHALRRSASLTHAQIKAYLKPLPSPRQRGL